MAENEIELIIQNKNKQIRDLNNNYDALISYFDMLHEQEWLEKLPKEFLDMPVC